MAFPLEVATSLFYYRDSLRKQGNNNNIKMCSFFGLNEKFDVKIDEIVKKFEDRLADIEDKQDSDYESNKSRFNEMEDKIDDLTNTISIQQQNYDRTIKELQRTIETSSEKQKELEKTIDQLNSKILKISSDTEKLNKEKDKTPSLESEIEELKEKVHQQSGI